VKKMTLESPLLAAVLGRLAERRLREQTHLAVAELESFHWGDLDPEREPAVRDHLALCPECVALLRALDGFAPSLAAPGMGVAEAEVEEALAANLATLRHPQPSPAAATVPLPLLPRWRQARGLYALAAAALAATLALSVGLWLTLRADTLRTLALEQRVASLEKELSRTGESRRQVGSDLDRLRSELSAAHDELAEVGGLAAAWLRPHVNTPVEQLRASPNRGLAAPGAAKVRLPAGADVLTLVLVDPQDERFPGYRFELRGPHGEKVAEAAGLERTPYRNFVVTLPSKILTRGRYAIHLVGVSGGLDKRIGVYEIEIVP
jgi:hypothetical protein